MTVVRWIVAGAACAGAIWAVMRQANAARSAARSAALPLYALANGRRIPEGYVLAGMIRDSDVPKLVTEGIALVLSLVAPEVSTVRKLSDAGIENNVIPTGSSWSVEKGMAAIAAVNDYDPAEVLIHCTHGVDRTGVVAAFLLVTRHGWTIPDALYAMVQPTATHVSGLASVLEEAGIHDRRQANDPSVGIYSLAVLNRVGGMKASTESYRNLIRTAIVTMRALR